MIDFTIFDVGSAGKFEYEKLDKICKYLNIHSFDLEKKREKNEFKSFHHNYNLVSSSSKKSNFYLTKNPAASSLKKPNNKIISRWRSDQSFKIKKKIKDIKTITLDKYIKNNKIKQIDFLHITAQASDLDIIKGIKNNLKKVSIIQCQVEFVKNYTNQNLFDDTIMFLRKQNFRFIKFIEKGEWNDKYIFAKAIFINEDYNNSFINSKKIIFLKLIGFDEEANWLCKDIVHNKNLIPKFNNFYKKKNLIFKIRKLIKSFLLQYVNLI